MPQEILPYIKFDSLLSKAFHGLDLPDAVRSQAEVQQMQQEQMQQQMAMAAGQTTDSNCRREQALKAVYGSSNANSTRRND